MPFTPRIKAAHGSPCPYCGVQMIIQPRKKGRNRTAQPSFPTRDHINPKHNGGGKTVIVCLSCNKDKGGLLINEWVERLSQTGDARRDRVASFLESLP